MRRNVSFQFLAGGVRTQNLVSHVGRPPESSVPPQLPSAPLTVGTLTQSAIGLEMNRSD
jgi:hypothetical protein